MGIDQEKTTITFYDSNGKEIFIQEVLNNELTYEVSSDTIGITSIGNLDFSVTLNLSFWQKIYIKIYYFIIKIIWRIKKYD